MKIDITATVDIGDEGQALLDAYARAFQPQPYADVQACVNDVAARAVRGLIDTLRLDAQRRARALIASPLVLEAVRQAPVEKRAEALALLGLEEVDGEIRKASEPEGDAGDGDVGDAVVPGTRG